MTHRTLPLLLAITALTACQSTTTGSSAAAGRTVGGTLERTTEGLGDAVLSPLEDLNLRREELPRVLRDQRSPYEIDAVGRDCDDLAARIAELDRVLGRDFDAPVKDEDEMTDEEIADKRAEQASGATLGFIAGEARGFIPFRGIIRDVSGASDAEKEAARAFAIGAQQRAYLKGIGEAKGCQPPAAPLPLPAPDDTSD